MLGKRFFSKGNKPLQPGPGQILVQPVSPSLGGQPYVVQPMQAVAVPQVQPIQYVTTPPVEVAPQVMPQQVTPQEVVSPPVDPFAGQAAESAFPVTPDPAAAGMDPAKREGLDMLTHLSQRSSQVIFKAADQARLLHLPYIDTEHLLYGLLFDGQCFQFMKQVKLNPVEMQKALEAHFAAGNFQGQPQFSPRVKRVLELAYALSRQVEANFVNPEHLVVGLAEEGEGIAAQILRAQKVDVQAVKGALVQDQKAKQDQVQDGNKVPTLADFTVDLTAKAKDGKLDPVIGRTTEIERAVHILSRRTKNNPALIGEAGTGKTAIVEGLAQRIVQGSVPQDLAHKRILSLDLMSLIAGASKRGEFEERLKRIIKELQQASGQIILFIDEMHNIIGTGGGDGTMDAGNILKPYLARGEIQVIGTDTIDEYRKHIEKDPALERRFQPVMVPEPSIDEAIAMVKGIRDKYEAFHRVKISDEAVDAAVKLSYRYIGDRFLPDKAVDLIDEAASLKRLPSISLPEEIKNLQTKLLHIEEERLNAQKMNNKLKLQQTQKDLEHAKLELDELVKRFETQKGSHTNVVEATEIEQIISRWTGIPITKLTESESEKLLHLEDRIHQRLIDQEGAVSAIAEAVRRGRAGLKASKRPIGSFLFLGPTGTGKTELAKTLAEVLFGSEDLLIRLDMTEYMEKHEVAKLIGAPPGYVGYEEGGQLTEAVRRKPYSVILLDEVEKAHPDVFNILIQVLEDGRLTDNKGRTINFKNTILICTSNLGTNLIQGEDLEGVTVQNIQSIGSSTENQGPAVSKTGTAQVPQKPNAKAEADANARWAALTKKLMDELKKFFRPELLNRFDEIVVFKPISRNDMIKITEIQLGSTLKLLQEQNIGIEIADAAKKHLAEIGYDPVYGARPLRRLIQQQIENPISSLIIKQEIKEGDTALVNFQNGEFIFSRREVPGEVKPAQTPQQAQANGVLSTQASPNAPQAASVAPKAPVAAPVPHQAVQDPSISHLPSVTTIPPQPAATVAPVAEPMAPVAAPPAPTPPANPSAGSGQGPSAFFENQKQFLEQMGSEQPQPIASTDVQKANT